MQAYGPVNSRSDDEETPSLRWAHQADKKTTSLTRKIVSTIGLLSVLLIGLVLFSAYNSTPDSRHDLATSDQDHPEAHLKESLTVSSPNPTGTVKSTWESNPPATQDNMYFALHPLEHAIRKPKTLQANWRITTGERRPDGVLKRVYLVNDHFIGPTIEARSGDSLKIEVENALEDEGLSLHWGGLYEGEASSKIAPGETRTIEFTIDEDQHGPFWYSAVDGAQKDDGLYGGIFVHEPSTRAPPYSEFLMLVSDWYHRPASEVEAHFMSHGSIGDESAPDSILLNGVGIFDCSKADKGEDCEQMKPEGLPLLSMLRQKKNVFHVLNVGAFAGVSLSVPDSQLTVIGLNEHHSVDAEPAKSVGVLRPGFAGDKLSVLVEPTSYGSGASALEMTLDTTPFKHPNTELTPTHRFPLKWIGLPQGPPNMPAKLRNFFDLGEVR